MDPKYLSRVDAHALVFGGSGGIGREVVRALVANGAHAVTFTYDRDASKAALEHNVRHLGYPYRPDVRVLGVAPGWVDTPLNATLPEDERKDVQGRIWLQRFGDPAEIAKVVAFLAGTGGSFATGTTIVVNGGFR